MGWVGCMGLFGNRRRISSKGFEQKHTRRVCETFPDGLIFTPAFKVALAIGNNHHFAHAFKRSRTRKKLLQETRRARKPHEKLVVKIARD